MSEIVEWIMNMASHDVPMDVMTAVMRADGYEDSDIAAAYDAVAAFTTTEVVRGLPYIRR